MSTLTIEGVQVDSYVRKQPKDAVTNKFTVRCDGYKVFLTHDRISDSVSIEILIEDFKAITRTILSHVEA